MKTIKIKKLAYLSILISTCLHAEDKKINTVGDILEQRTQYLQSEGSVTSQQLLVQEKETSNKLKKLQIEERELDKQLGLLQDDNSDKKGASHRASTPKVAGNDFAFSNVTPLKMINNPDIKQPDLKYTENLVTQTNTWINSLKDKVFVSDISEMAGHREATLWQNGRSFPVEVNGHFKHWIVANIDMDGVVLIDKLSSKSKEERIDISSSQLAIDAFNQAQNIRNELIQKQMAILESAAISETSGIGMSQPLNVQPLVNDSGVPGQMFR